MQTPPNFDEVQVGSEIPTVSVGPITTQDLVKWAGASGDFNPIHYDKDIAQAQGLPTVVIPGTFRLAWAASVLQQWAGPRGRLKRLQCSYRGLDLPGDILNCGIKITNKFVDADGSRNIECEFWITNPRDEKSTIGSARVMLA